MKNNLTRTGAREELDGLVTAVHNGARYLERVVESVAGQTVAVLEHIVVDDGSRDDTPAILRQLRERHPHLVDGIDGAAAFLVFNAPPARIFMGDGGSLFLGYSIALLSIAVPVNSAGMVSIAVPVVLLAVPILDTAVAIVRRLRRGLPIHTPDREHLHHKLLAVSRRGSRALLVLAALSTLLSAGAVYYAVATHFWAVLVVPLTLASAGAAYRYIHHLWVVCGYAVEVKVAAHSCGSVPHPAATFGPPLRAFMDTRKAGELAPVNGRNHVSSR